MTPGRAATRGHSTIFAKDSAKKSPISYLRLAIRQFQGTSFVNDQQRVDLGLNVRKPPKPIGVPGSAPVGRVVRVDQNVVTYEFRAPRSDSRAKPGGSVGLTLFAFLGDAPSTDVTDWTAMGISGKTTVAVAYPTKPEPFSRVWICAQYFNAKGEAGPASVPVSTNLGTWLVQDVATATTTQTLRAA